MLRYVALVWDPVDPGTKDDVRALSENLCRVDAAWTCAYQAQGLLVYTARKSAAALREYGLPDGHGIVLGRLFRQGAPNAPTIDVAVGAERARRYVASGGAELAKDYWGGYVAFLVDATNRKHYVLRDCSGKVPCFLTKYRSVGIVFADINDVRGIPGLRLRIDWEYLASFLYYEQLQIRRSGLVEVTEVLAGDQVEFSRSQVLHRVLWDPRAIVRDSLELATHEAAEALRATAQTCVNDWARQYDNVLHSLSGGLDSAVVLGCLMRTPNRPRVTCLNRFTELAGEDERSYARNAAAMAGVALTERHWREGSRLIDERVLSLSPAAKPALPQIAASLDMDSRNQLATAVNAEATWTGQGGDHLFYEIATPLMASDFARVRGLRPGLLRAIHEGARISGDSYASVARRALRSLVTNPAWAPAHLLKRQPYFLSRDAVPADILNETAHPWTRDCDDLPAGKQLQIYFLGELTNRHRSALSDERAPEHHPLMSQPLIELCLRLPTYTLLSGGRSRGLARSAFVDCVPRSILDRETKGSTTSFWMHIVHESSDFLRELLHDGVLIRERIVERDSVEPYLGGSRPMPLELFPSLLACVAAEIWARSWRDRRLSLAA
jgi:asparagine synthase (glutamine-hydrolysing)